MLLVFIWFQSISEDGLRREGISALAKKIGLSRINDVMTLTLNNENVKQIQTLSTLKTCPSKISQQVRKESTSWFKRYHQYKKNVMPTPTLTQWNLHLEQCPDLPLENIMINVWQSVQEKFKSHNLKIKIFYSVNILAAWLLNKHITRCS